jgi:hypothetical protein
MTYNQKRGYHSNHVKDAIRVTSLRLRTAIRKGDIIQTKREILYLKSVTRHAKRFRQNE